MINTADQLKAMIRNMARGDSGRAQLLMRNYAMERFLERITLSKYRDNFILKGGMLIAAIVGLDRRATMDIDAAIRNLPLNAGEAKQIVAEIAALDIGDNVLFSIKDVTSIMDEAEYSGVRLSLDTFLDKTRIPLKLDISTGDIITPAAIGYHYQLMFEQRYISLWSYPIETVLAEKIETVLVRTIYNTRLRDFYDLYILQNAGIELDKRNLAVALKATCRKRGSETLLPMYRLILAEIEANKAMQAFWNSYQNKNSYAATVTWSNVLNAVRSLCDACIL